IGFHGHKSPKHLERSTVPVFNDLVMRCKVLVDKGTKILSDRLAPMPIADTKIGNGVVFEAVKALAPGLVVDLAPEREQPIWCRGLGKSPRSHIDILWMSGLKVCACGGNACKRDCSSSCEQSATSKIGFVHRSSVRRVDGGIIETTRCAAT